MRLEQAIRAMLLGAALLAHGVLWGTVGVDLVGWPVSAIGSFVGGGVIGWHALRWIG